MGTLDLHFVTDLRNRLGLARAVETGTFRGVTARRLSNVFPEVVTVELSEELHRTAGKALSDVRNIRLVQGHSIDRLHELRDATVPTLYFLDGHWSGSDTDGATDQCPVLGELQAIGEGHPNDCIVIDDARMFTSSPPPPMDAEQWPSLLELFDALRAQHPDHVITVLADQVIAVPAAAKQAVDAYGVRLTPRFDFGTVFAARNWLDQKLRLARGRTR